MIKVLVKVYCINNELILLHCNIVVGGSQQETLDPGFLLLGTHQQDIPVILRKLVLPDGLDPVSPSFAIRDVTTRLSGPRPTSCRNEMQSQLTDHLVVINIMCVV
ncbi:unnamed protein product [Schistosoma margrebowiei]|uniref:Uncharacterized protein n=1 Tax=Schistosoma margrebowiei TaxID=48269 RepID=A0A183M5E6_9TREM|nr:unnamed protein product [Schistosoma margrebowiei]